MHDVESLESLFPLDNVGYLVGLLKEASGFREGLSETDRVPASAALHTLQTSVANVDEELIGEGKIERPTEALKTI